VKVVVTGAAGFIGSTLAERLVGDGHEVLGVDCFTPYYPVEAKRANLAQVLEQPSFTLVEADLRTADVQQLLAGADVVFHLAGQPGVRLSWTDGFCAYVEHNVLVTQRLLEAARTAGVARFVYASSSSVYGNAARYPTAEQDPTQPHSPYGVTKLGAENLCVLYAANWGVPTVALRYFTVYGPRQRPDMAIHRLIGAALSGQRFTLYGDGNQIRDFTYVDDVVRATAAAGLAEVPPGTVVNVSGGSSMTMGELIALVEEVVGHPIRVRRITGQAGDVERTGGSVARAARLLGWQPQAAPREGLVAQVGWHREHVRPSWSRSERSS
jgi:nucleoside-diphosphate-sugar epimerase